MTNSGGIATDIQNYEPLGTPSNSALSSLTNLYFTGQFREQDTGLQWHRARWLNTGQGRWLSTDPVFDFPGNFGNGYTYVADNLLNRTDISGQISLVEKTIVAAIVGAFAGAAFGVLFNGLANVYISEGDWSTYFDNWEDAALLGAILGALGGGLGGLFFGLIVAQGVAAGAAALQSFLIVLILYELPISLISFFLSLENAESKREKHVVYAGGILSIIVGIAGGRLLFKKSFKQPQARRRDVDVRRQSSHPNPPRRSLDTKVFKGKQKATIEAEIEKAKLAGAEDIRVNQEQVDAQNIRVGRNRPDLQYTLNGKRYYVEIDPPRSKSNPDTSIRGPGHERRILSNDPDGIVIQIIAENN